jgi:GH15 family glucan-1,4-alpha-glucosidase
MPRPLVVGNGNLLVTLDGELNIRDLYWPYVGLYNHISGHRARLGLWLDGRFSWLSDPAWQRDLRYEPDTLVTRAVCHNEEFGVTLTLNDCVAPHEDVLLRRITIENHQNDEREARVFFAHDFRIAESDIGDTAFYNPFVDAVIHYKRDYYFLIAASGPQGGLHQYAIGIKGFGGAEGTWRDAEDGELSMNAVAQGSVDSTISVRGVVPANGQIEFHAWICAAHSLADVTALYGQVTTEDLAGLQKKVGHYWQLWSQLKTDRLALLPEPIPEVFRRSLLTIRTNIDNRGAIIAANDSDIMETARAHYSYMWPRDGALVAESLDRLGYEDLTQRFFQFCLAALPKDRAVLLHKYSADGSWGSTWHPWTVDGENEVPFQEDSTSLVLWALKRHYDRYGDLEFMTPLYENLVVPCANFLASYRDPETGLPLPSYDLWEERRGVHAYTCGTLYGALASAADLSDVFGDGRAEAYRTAARELREGMERHLWDEASGRFARRLIPRPGGHGYDKDMTIDSALCALQSFGAFGADDPRIKSTMRAVISRLWVQSGPGGIARYEGDYYFRRSDDLERIPGNPWVICTLWVAQWYIAQAREEKDLVPALELLMWAAHRALPSGILAEQFHPETGEPLSVAPLTWSHAEFVATSLNYLDRLETLQSVSTVQGA